MSLAIAFMVKLENRNFHYLFLGYPIQFQWYAHSNHTTGIVKAEKMLTLHRCTYMFLNFGNQCFEQEEEQGRSKLLLY